MIKYFDFSLVMISLLLLTNFLTFVSNYLPIMFIMSSIMTTYVSSYYVVVLCHSIRILCHLSTIYISYLCVVKIMIMLLCYGYDYATMLWL
ncbi:unnamed protein product [Callosobruchus maculatus]|uniref:Uncharacterized protein n=1 Tax=Callosobruchus maculatus TaxID=64391 RepID=A0A653BPB6_CALMS|nr:unnamed protein product [Callosobruchus maculatus]VEN52411.1 unnamed protein product [Callosobruchus maculatus]